MSIKVGIIGCGVISINHILPLLDLECTELVAVCDIDEEKAKATALKYNTVYYTDYKEMVEKEQLDSVHVLLPHYLHSEVSIYCLNHGLDVLCEKPMAIRFEDALKMKEACEKSGKRLGIIFQNRYHAGAVAIKSALDSGKLGKITGAWADVLWSRDQAYYDSGEWRGKWKTEGGGVLINQSIHTLDLVRYFVGSEIADINSSVDHKGTTNIEVDDVSEGIITYENGVREVYYVTNNYPGFRPVHIMLECENGRVELVGSVATIEYKNGEKTVSEDFPLRSVGKQCYGSGHFVQLKDFYENPESYKFMLDQALKTQKMIDGIYNSAGIER